MSVDGYAVRTAAAEMLVRGRIRDALDVCYLVEAELGEVFDGDRPSEMLLALLTMLAGAGVTEDEVVGLAAAKLTVEKR